MPGATIEAASAYASTNACVAVAGMVTEAMTEAMAVAVAGAWAEAVGSFCGGAGKCVLCTVISLWACNCLSAFVLLDMVPQCTFGTGLGVSTGPLAALTSFRFVPPQHLGPSSPGWGGWRGGSGGAKLKRGNGRLRAHPDAKPRPKGAIRYCAKRGRVERPPGPPTDASPGPRAEDLTGPRLRGEPASA